MVSISLRQYVAAVKWGKRSQVENRQLVLAFAGMATNDADAYRRRRGHWLRVARQAEGLTLKEVAREMGYSLRSASTIKLWEDGKRDPSDVQLRHLAEVLNRPIDVFTDPDETDEERLVSRTRAVLADKARRDRSSA